MFQNSLVSVAQLASLSKSLPDLNMDMPCNQALVKSILIALPSCYPFSMDKCVTNNSDYRLWCSLRHDVLTQCKDLADG